MSYEVGKQALDFLIANSGNRRNLEVDFFGGEPLMNWDVVKRLVEYGREQEKIHDKNFRFTLTTNGVLLNDEIMEFCNQLPRYKRPHKIIFAQVPRNPTGKIEKPRLREMYGGASLVAKQNHS